MFRPGEMRVVEVMPSRVWKTVRRLATIGGRLRMGSSILRKTLVTGGAGSSAHPAAHNRLRILFCTLGYEPGPGSGAEHQARLQADELVRRGHHVTVVCLDLELPSRTGGLSGFSCPPV